MFLDVESVVRVDAELVTTNLNSLDRQDFGEEHAGWERDQLGYERRYRDRGVVQGKERVDARSDLNHVSIQIHSTNEHQVQLTKAKAHPSVHIRSVLTGSVVSSVFGTTARTSAHGELSESMVYSFSIV